MVHLELGTESSRSSLGWTGRGTQRYPIIIRSCSANKRPVSGLRSDATLHTGRALAPE